MSAHTCKYLFHRAHHNHPGTRLHPGKNEQLLTGSEIIDKERRAGCGVVYDECLQSDGRVSSTSSCQQKRREKS